MQIAFSSILLKRLLIGWVLSWLLALATANGGSIPFAITLAFFTLGSGSLIALLSSWHYLLPSHRRNGVIVFTTIFTYVLGILVFQFDISRREELDALFTVLILAPQLVLIAACVTIFGIKDRSRLAHQ